MSRRTASIVRQVIPCAVLALVLIALGGLAPARAQVGYSITDGAADLTLSIDPAEEIVFLNTFPVDPGGAFVDQILVAYGRVGGPTALNGKPVRILLYEDTDGGSPQNAVLRWWRNTTIANGNTNTLNVYSVPRIHVTGTLVVGFYFRNTNGFPVYIGALDTTAPTLFERSWTGYAATVDPASLGDIPPGQWGPQEVISAPGNFRIEARGQATGDIALQMAKMTALGVVRLTWTGSSASYVVERASSPSFVDAQTLATGPETSYDDPALGDGTSWFYRVR